MFAMNPRLQQLQPYPFEKLARLQQAVQPATDRNPIMLAMGEPRHTPPGFVLRAIGENLMGVSKYPGTRGSDELRAAIAGWLARRFGLNAANIDPASQILPVNGTREALFAFAQCIADGGRAKDTVLMPNPFYQIYEGATILAGMRPQFYPIDPENAYQPDFDSISNEVWDRCQLIYLCSPGNPTGGVLSQQTLVRLLERAHQHDFIIAADECYSEIYADEHAPPPGLLQACAAMGNDRFSRAIVFHSLSKRSNLPGLRSGFVAGEARLIAAFFRYRTYHGCSMSPMVQAASAAAWGDEQHVRDNRRQYREKFTAVLDILTGVLPVRYPAAGFYLWPQLPVDDEHFTTLLYRQANVSILPGRYLARDQANHNPGKNHVRIALVAERQDCITAARDMRTILRSL